MIATDANGRVVPVLAHELAAGLAVLFERDVAIVERLNDAQHRLRDANERLWSGLSADALGLIDDGAAPGGGTKIAALGAGGPGSEAELLSALQQIHWAIHEAFCQYQSACEERRQLAVDVGELSQQLIEVLGAAGWSASDARAANVHELARAFR